MTITVHELQGGLRGYRNPVIDAAIGAPTLLFGQPDPSLPIPALTEQVAALAPAARELDCRRVLGPMDGSTWHSYRAVVERMGDGFAGDVSSHPQLARVLEQAGFEVVERYASAALSRAAARVAIENYADHTRGYPLDIRLRPVSRPAFLGALAACYPLVSTTFQRNRLYSPIGREEFVALYRPLSAHVRDGWLQIAEVGAREVGFVLFLEDARGLVLKTLGRLPGPELRRWSIEPTRLGAALALKAFGHLLAGPHERLILALMHESNPSYARAIDFGGEVVARYALYGREA